MTAIIRNYIGIDSGFITVADGRLTGEDKVTVLSDCKRKIFPVSFSDANLALSFIGADQLDDIGIQTTVLNSARELSALSADGLVTLGDHLVGSLLSELEGKLIHLEAGAPEIDKLGRTLVEIMVDGYLRGFPLMATFRVYHVDGNIQPLGIESYPLFVEGLPLIYGPSKLTNLLYPPPPTLSSGSPRLTEYIRSTPVNSIESAIDFSSAYISACTEPEAISVDELCRTVGGHVHASLVTKTDGFRWIPGYEPEVDSA